MTVKFNFGEQKSWAKFYDEQLLFRKMSLEEFEAHNKQLKCAFCEAGISKHRFFI